MKKEGPWEGRAPTDTGKVGLRQQRVSWSFFLDSQGQGENFLVNQIKATIRKENWFLVSKAKNADPRAIHLTSWSSQDNGVNSTYLLDSWEDSLQMQTTGREIHHCARLIIRGQEVSVEWTQKEVFTGGITERFLLWAFLQSNFSESSEWNK